MSQIPSGQPCPLLGVVLTHESADKGQNMLQNIADDIQKGLNGKIKNSMARSKSTVVRMA